jgi:hypothetical protein
MKAIRFARSDHSVHFTRADPAAVDVALRVTDSKAHIADPEENGSAVIWHTWMPLSGFGKYFKLPEIRMEPAIMAIIGEGNALVAKNGQRSGYRATPAKGPVDLVEYLEKTANQEGRQAAARDMKGAREKVLVALAIGGVLSTVSTVAFAFMTGVPQALAKAAAG